MERDKERIIKNSNESIFIELLPVLDDMENAMKRVNNSEERKGIEMIFNNFFKILEKNGLKRIDAFGKKVDVYYHDAIMKEKSNKEDRTILEEIQAGYMLNDKVIRHSKVKISEKGDNNG